MDTPICIFELLLKNNKFMYKLDDYLNTVIINNKIDISKIPEITLFLVTALKYVIEKKLSYDESENLLNIFINYILNINIYTSQLEKKEHNNISIDMFNACIKIALTNTWVNLPKKYC